METKALTTKEIIALLANKFPLCFSVEGQAKPLKVGIFQEIAEQLTEEDNVSKTRLRQVLRHYTSSWRYLKSIKVGAQRVDLSGESVAEIDQEQAEHAKNTLKESQDKFGYKDQKNKAKKDSNAKVDAKSTAKKAQKFQNVKSTKSAKATNKPVKEVKLEQVNPSTVKVGANVKVKFGNSPMNAVVTEVDGSDVHVQLTSGMVVKTQVEQIFN